MIQWLGMRNRLSDKKIQLGLTLWLLAVLGCNMPIFASRQADAGQEDQKAARETLAARLFATPLSAGPTQAAATPAPGEQGELLPTQPLVTPGIPLATLEEDTYRYITQPGDTTTALALRFGVQPEQVLSPALFPANRLLPAGLMLSIPNTLEEAGFYEPLMPDSEIIYSPTTLDFSVDAYVQSSGGYLSTYTEQVEGETLSGAQIIQRVADETSISPRMLLAFLEHRAGWVRGSPTEGSNHSFPIGYYAGEYAGLYKEITLVARQLTIGYYGWRSGKVLYLPFIGGAQQRIHPTVNAGTAALQVLFSTLYKPDAWGGELYGDGRFLEQYQEMFGDPWQRASAAGVVLPDALAQPDLELPFPAGERWSFTGGPHAAWGVGSAWGGLDFAPGAVEPGCSPSRFWVTSASAGVVVRSGHGQVLVDLDGDGREQTGWVLLYMHVAARERIALGSSVNVGDRIGHPSCEGGVSTGTHMHVARKYNGEWIGADGPAPFVLSGWQAVYGDRPYLGVLVNGDQIVTASSDGSHITSITH